MGAAVCGCGPGKTGVQPIAPGQSAFVKIEATEPVGSPPAWALLQRDLIDRMNRAAPILLEKYVRADGTILWPPSPDFQSVDALDDAYESFHNWPLFYLLGGDQKILALAHKEFEAITKQFTRYGTGQGYPMVVKEYQPGYDWMHQGEGNYLFYMLCMADPTRARNVERARRFAGLYLNEDPDAQTYDPAHKIIRCTHNGSKGPAFWNFSGRPIWTLEGYGLPFYDVPGCETVEDLKKPEVARRMGKIADDRRGKGDSVSNLAATGLLTNAYLLTGDPKYKTWVREYVDAWIERVRQNNGILPDNVGLSGKIGEHIDGKWYGGNYGWTWPHGWGNLGQAVVIAAECAALLTGDLKYMVLPRSQIDVLTANGIEKDGTFYVPHKYGDPGKVRYKPWSWNLVLRNDDGTALQKDGWFEFTPMHPSFIAHVWGMSMDARDVQRAKKLRSTGPKPSAAGHPFKINSWSAKDQAGNAGPWMSFLSGEYPNYPEEILRHNLSQVYGRLAFMRQDREDPKKYGDSYLQRRNPITCEGLVQLTMGGPLPIYNGGLLVTRVRYYDGNRKRPGLPEDVAALVSKMTADRTVLQLINLSVDQPRDVIVQAGAMGEHRFTTAQYRARIQRRWKKQTAEVNGKYLHVHLPPGTQITLDLATQRFVNDPSYKLPW